MPDPVITVEIAFATLPLEPAPSWEDVSAYVLEWWTSRGRNRALDRIEAGTAGLRLDNMDRRFDPTNTAGPYYPNVLPVRRLRISAVYSAATYYIYDGYVDEWPLDWEEPLDSEITITCTDLFGYFNRLTHSGALSAEFSNHAIDSLLDIAFGNVAIAPGPGRSLSSGHTLIEAATLTNKNVLQHLQDIAEAESGVLFIDGQGRVVFHDRHYRLTQTTSLTPIATYGFSGGELPYMGNKPSYSADLIKNDIHITATGGSEQTASDATSQLQYWQRSYVRSGLLIGDASGVGGSTKNAEALNLAQWILYNNKDALLRIDAITVSGDNDAGIWPSQLGGEISKRVRVKWTSPSGSTITQDCYIEAIKHRKTPQTWLTTWQLSPADSGGWWILDTSVLDTSTRLAY